jgi:hypothetical protein
MRQGHAFNALKQNGRLTIVDGQSGRVGTARSVFPEWLAMSPRVRKVEVKVYRPDR